MTADRDTLLEQLLGFAERGHHQGVRNILAQHPELAKAAVAAPTSKHIKGTTALHLAAHKGETVVMKILIDAGADIEARNAVGETPLIDAAGGSRDAAVELLLENGANPDSATPQGFTPLMAAARRGCILCVYPLLAAKANLHALNAQDQNALHFAAMAADAQNGELVANALVKAGIDYRQRDSFGETPVDVARSSNGPMAMRLTLVIDEDVARRAEESRRTGIAQEF
ncbi:MAG TPA: ankyrin repeat domain-containing protein, partial [Patescibacteria group bacterium]|nr:ankyrin repeat domain-containing protein [Patescibacteria group bacterium]